MNPARPRSNHLAHALAFALRVAAAGASLAGTGGVLSCIIAEPPADLPRLPVFRPTIIHGSVVPPASSVLGVFPDKFVVPVELVDPTVAFQWRAFIDYNPLTGEGIADYGTSSFDPASGDSGVRSLEVALSPPNDLTRCHVIEFLVANGFRGDFEGRQAHTPDQNGGDSVVWFFSPTGDLGGCPVYDAGLAVDGSFPPTGSDGGAE